LKQERLAREQAQEQARQAESEVERLKEQLRSLGVDPDTI
ncbi:Uma2 family endonuclease, partial [Nostoc sp. CHAB 5715]|nr:Uma2 family endonuclease [Nostoc sp. CHAB 5715]